MVPHFTSKSYIRFCHLTPPFPENGHASQKLFFAVILENIVFLKNLLNQKHSNPHFLQKFLYWFLSSDTPFLSKWLCPPTNGFLEFFKLKLKNNREVFLLESILIWKKILWRINFVLIKFSPNVLLFEKLWNECKNSSFLHKVTCTRSDYVSAAAKFHIHGF